MPWIYHTYHIASVNKKHLIFSGVLKVEVSEVWSASKTMAYTSNITEIFSYKIISHECCPLSFKMHHMVVLKIEAQIIL